MKHTDIIKSLSLEQKCALLSGGTVFTTRALPGKGIPAITLSDGPNGVRKQAGAADHLGLNPSVPATCFPTSATVANSWDPELGEAVGAAMGEEAAAQGVSVLLGPGLNIKRSPLCGRNFEYFSEDPYLAGKMAAAYVRGIQKNGIAACPKHFAVNSQELRRMASDSVVDERTLREIYLTGFEMVVKEAQPKTIMSAYNLVNGTYANENTHLLMEILRRDWGFDGAVVTDWGGSNDHALGVKNGSTLEMPAPGGDAIRELMKAVQTSQTVDYAKKKIMLSLTSEKHPIDIRYTTDGSEPTVSSKLYKKPFAVKDSILLTARLFDGEKPIGKSLHLRTDYHKGIGKKITYAPGGRYYQHKEVYKGGGDAGLLDGLRGGKSYMDGRWQGFCPNDLDAIIDLGEVTAIHRVMANFMQIRTPQVFLPAKVEVWASVDGKNFTLLGSDICSEEEAGKDVIFRDFGWIGTPTETRYVRFHAIQGKKQFLFTDEIVIQ